MSVSDETTETYANYDEWLAAFKAAQARVQAEKQALPKAVEEARANFRAANLELERIRKLQPPSEVELSRQLTREQQHEFDEAEEQLAVAERERDEAQAAWGRVAIRPTDAVQRHSFIAFRESGNPAAERQFHERLREATAARTEAEERAQTALRRANEMRRKYAGGLRAPTP